MIEIKHKLNHEVLYAVDGSTLVGANLVNINLAGADLQGVNLSGADLTGTNLSNSNCSRAIFTVAELEGANLSNANCYYANFTAANLRNVQALYTSFVSAFLDHANLEGADLTNAKFDRATVQGATYSKATRNPPCFARQINEKDSKGSSLRWIKNLFKRNTLLQNAVRTSKVDEVRRLLAKGANVHARDENGEPPLRLAEDIRVAELLLANGADVNAHNGEGLMPLHNAAYIKNDGLAELYLKHGAVVEPNTSPMTPLIRAVKSGGSEYQLALFLKYGANPNVKDDMGISPINHIQGQTMQGVFLLLAAIDSLLKTTDRDLVTQCHQLRDRVIRLLDDTILKGRKPPGEIDLDMRRGMAVRDFWKQIVSSRYNLMRQQFKVLEDSILVENPKLWDQLRSEKRRLIADQHRG